MRFLTLLSFCFIPIIAFAQRVVSGKVIEETGFIAMPGVKILNRDSLLVATTDLNGNFLIDLPAESDTLLLGSIGMEWLLIKVPTDCSALEITMLSDVIYDFSTFQSINRRRHKRFRNLTSKHRQAFNKGIFTSNLPCVRYIFEKFETKPTTSH